MLALIAGPNVGVAKKVKPYVVRVPRRKQNGGGSKPDDWLAGVAKVLDRFDKPSKTTLAILNLSWSWDEDTYERHPLKGDDDFLRFRNRLADLLNRLVENGVFVVTGSGNNFIVRLATAPSWSAVP